MSIELPKAKSQWVITIFGIIYVVLEFYILEILDIDLLTATDSELYYHWLLRLMSAVSLMIFISGALILSIRTLRRDGFAVKRCVIPSIMILFCFLITAVSIFGQRTMSDIQQKLFHYDDDFKDKLKESLDKKDLPLSERSMIGLMYAKQIWKNRCDYQIHY